VRDVEAEAGVPERAITRPGFTITWQFIVFSALTTRVAGNARWICSPPHPATFSSRGRARGCYPMSELYGAAWDSLRR